MSLILSIESGTEICSVGIARDGEIIALRESVEGRDHARLVAKFADEVLTEVGISASDLSAVAVSKGPGSYTGLRIGVSFAKGLCYGSNIPLIGVSSLQSLARNAIDLYSAGALAIEESVWRNARLIPMIDARRMEVYTQIFNLSCEAEGDVEAKVVDESSYCEFRSESERNMILFGNGAEKCVDILPGLYFVDVKPSASSVARLATELYAKGEFEDVAYFEPLYLKDAKITISKRRYF